MDVNYYDFCLHFQMTNDLEHFFMWSLSLYIFLGEMSILFFPHFKIQLLFFILLNCKSSLGIMDTIPLLGMAGKYFLFFCVWYFHRPDAIVSEQFFFLILMKSIYVYFCFLCFW